MRGTALGPYRVLAELGAGGMGKVYAAVVEGRAPGLDTGTRVALKVVHPQLLESPGFFLRFVRDAEIGRAVVHENVVRTHMADAQAALAALAEAGEAGDSAEIRLLLWQATGDRAHLAEAKRRLDDLVAHAPPECRESMLTNVRLNREIVAACREQGV